MKEGRGFGILLINLFRSDLSKALRKDFVALKREKISIMMMIIIIVRQGSFLSHNV